MEIVVANLSSVNILNITASSSCKRERACVYLEGQEFTHELNRSDHKVVENVTGDFMQRNTVAA